MTSTDAVVARLVELWRRNPPFAARLRPGLRREHIEAALWEVFLVPRPELCSWWGAHDGIEDSDRSFGAGFMGGSFLLLSLEQALALREERLGGAVRHGWLDGEDWRVFLPIAEHFMAQDVLVMDCSGSERAGGIYLIRGEPDDQRRKAASLSDLVSLWVRAHESGYITYDPAAGPDAACWATHGYSFDEDEPLLV